MRTLLALTLISSLLLTACDPAKVGKEATEAFQNLSNEANEIKTNIENTVDSVSEAATAIQDATGEIKDLTKPNAE